MYAIRSYYVAAQSTATVVILMGMGKLPEIVEIFKSQNKHDLAVAVIQNGTTVNEKVGFGTINTIEKVVEKEHVITSYSIHYTKLYEIGII